MSSADYNTPMSAEGSTGSGIKEQARETAGTAADAGKHVAGVAKDEARQVASEARDQIRNLMNQARTQVEDTSRTQRDRLVQNLRAFAGDLEKMADQNGGSMATDLVRRAAGTTRSLTDKLDGREPSELLDEVRHFARQRPGAFLLGALAAGVVAGRVARGAKDAGNQSDTDTGIEQASGGSPAETSPPPVGQPTGVSDTTAGSAGTSTTPDPYAGPGSSWGGASAPGTGSLTGEQPGRGLV